MISIACSGQVFDNEILFRYWTNEPADQTKPALVAAAAAPPPSKRLSGWEAGAKKDAKADGGGSCNVTSELK